MKSGDVERVAKELMGVFSQAGVVLKEILTDQMSNFMLYLVSYIDCFTTAHTEGTMIRSTLGLDQELHHTETLG